jgi:hypothetical protein
MAQVVVVSNLSTVSLEKPSFEEMHRFYRCKENRIPIWQIKKRRPPDAIVSEKLLLLFNIFRIPPTHRMLDLLNNISFWPSAPVKVFYILNLEITASTKIGCHWAYKSTSLMCHQHIGDDGNKYSADAPQARQHVRICAEGRLRAQSPTQQSAGPTGQWRGDARGSPQPHNPSNSQHTATTHPCQLLGSAPNLVEISSIGGTTGPQRIGAP